MGRIEEKCFGARDIGRDRDREAKQRSTRGGLRGRQHTDHRQQTLGGDALENSYLVVNAGPIRLHFAKIWGFVLGMN